MMDKARRFAELVARKREIEADLRIVNAQIEDARPKAEQEMIDAGIPRLPVAGMLLFFGQQIRASFRKGMDPEAARRAFTRVGLGDLVPRRMNIQAVKAHIRERLENEEAVEPTIARWVDYKSWKELRAVADDGAAAPSAEDMKK